MADRGCGCLPGCNDDEGNGRSVARNSFCYGPDDDAPRSKRGKNSEGKSRSFSSPAGFRYLGRLCPLPV